MPDQDSEACGQKIKITGKKIESETQPSIMLSEPGMYVVLRLLVLWLGVICQTQLESPFVSLSLEVSPNLLYCFTTSWSEDTKCVK